MKLEITGHVVDRLTQGNERWNFVKEQTGILELDWYTNHFVVFKQWFGW